MKTLSITFRMVSELPTERQTAAAARAFGLHRATRRALPPFPVLLLPKERADFTPDRCLVALADGGRVVGCALLTPCPPLPALCEKIGNRLGAAAADATARACGTLPPGKPLFEIGAICVDPAFRNRGVGGGFYREAARRADGGVYAVITADNAASRAAANAAGYEAAPGSHHTVRFALENGVPVPRAGGGEKAVAGIFLPSLALPPAP